MTKRTKKAWTKWRKLVRGQQMGVQRVEIQEAFKSASIELLPGFSDASRVRRPSFTKRRQKENTMNLKRSILQATFFLAVIAASLTLAGAARAQDLPVFAGKFTLTSTVHWGKSTLPPGTYSLSIYSIGWPVMATIRNENSTVATRVLSVASGDSRFGSNLLRLKPTGDGSLAVQSLVLADLHTVLIYDASPVRQSVGEARADSTAVLVARK